MCQTFERAFLCDVINEDDGANVPVVVGHHALPKSLLPGRIPQLKSVGKISDFKMSLTTDILLKSITYRNKGNIKEGNLKRTSNYTLKVPDLKVRARLKNIRLIR